MNGLRQSLLKHQSLQSTLQEGLWRQGEDVIEFVLVFLQQSIAIHASHESTSLEDPFGIGLVKHKQCPCRVSDLGEGHLDAPELPFVLQTVFTHELQLGLETLLLKRTTRSLRDLSP